MSMPDLSDSSSSARGHFACKLCRSRIASRKAILSWAFRGNKGKAALFAAVVESRVRFMPQTLLLMDSGAHTVQDVVCSVCNTTLGWKFVRAHEWPEKWKEGNIVLELELLEEEYSGSPLKQEISPLSDETNMAKKLLVPGLDPAYRRSTSDLSERRMKPLGPRNHKSMQVLNTVRNIIHARS